MAALCKNREPSRHTIRGIDPHRLHHCSLWLHGPSIPPDEASDVEPTVMPEECKSEQKRTKKAHDLLTAAGHTIEVKIGSVINCENFGSKGRLLRVTAYVLKFVKLLQRGTGRSAGAVPKNIQSVDLQEAEVHWMKGMQTSLEASPKFTDESGVWRCDGRLTNADIPFMMYSASLDYSDCP